MSISKNVFKTSIIYFVGQVLTKLISFVLLPLYTNYISTADFGFYDLSLSVLGVAVPVIFMEIWSGTLRFAIEKSDDGDKKRVINNSLIIAIVSLAIYSLGYIVFFWIMKFDLPIWIYVYSIVWIFQLLLLSAARVYGENSLYASSGVINVLFSALITIAAVKLTNGNVASLYIGVTLGIVAQIILIEYKVKMFRSFTFKDFDKGLCHELIVFSFPLSINSVVYWMMEGFNKIIISGKLGIAANGIYAVGNRLSTVLNLVLQVFLLSWQETIFKMTDSDEKSEVYNVGFNLLIKVIGGGLVLLLPLICIAFPYIIGTNYASAKNLIPFLLLVIFLNSLSGILSSCFAAEKDNKSSLISKCVTCCVNMAILFVSIGSIGLYASPLALCISNIIGISIQIILMKKHVNIIPNFSYIIVFAIAFTISLFVYISDNNFMNIIWFFIASIFYIIYLRDFIKKILSLVFGMIKFKRG